MPRTQQEQRLCGARGARGSPPPLPARLWRHPAPGLDPALGCRLPHSRVPYSGILPSSEGIRSLLSSSQLLVAAVLQEPLAALAWWALRPEDAQVSRERVLCPAAQAQIPNRFLFVF